MATVRSFATLPLITSALVAQAPDFRNTSWGMDRAQVMATEGTPPSQVRERGGEIVLRYESAPLAGLDCRVVYIFAKDKLVRTKYVFQREHDEKNEFLADFTMVDAFLMGVLERALPSSGYRGSTRSTRRSRSTMEQPSPLDSSCIRRSGRERGRS